MTVSVHQTGQLTGTLSGRGHDQLRIVVLTDAVPPHLPPELQDLARPVYDPDGHLCDWRLDLAHAEQPVRPEDFQRFIAWRARYAAERYLGERALITALLDWAAHRCDVSTLQVLRLDHARVDYHRALEMSRQLAQTRQYLERHAATGYGLYAPGSRRAIRGFIPGDAPATVLGLGGAAMTLTADGLTLRHGGSQTPVLGWRVQESTVTIRTPDGEQPVTASDAARLVRMVGRQAPEIEVRQCPVNDLVAPLLSFGKEAADLAGTAHNGLYLYSS
ncbi:MAG TPA: hypothetical protein VMB79_12190 [Jatrophihabitans sp.]|nr:hypothetical protein [Jatrophihabitans sp.]